MSSVHHALRSRHLSTMYKTIVLHVKSMTGRSSSSAAPLSSLVDVEANRVGAQEKGRFSTTNASSGDAATDRTHLLELLLYVFMAMAGGAWFAFLLTVRGKNRGETICSKSNMLHSLRLRL